MYIPGHPEQLNCKYKKVALLSDTGYIGLQLYVAAFSEPDDNRIRVISLRKASPGEEKLHVRKNRRA